MEEEVGVGVAKKLHFQKVDFHFVSSVHPLLLATLSAFVLAIVNGRQMLQFR